MPMPSNTDLEQLIQDLRMLSERTENIQGRFKQHIARMREKQDSINDLLDLVEGRRRDRDSLKAQAESPK